LTSAASAANGSAAILPGNGGGGGVSVGSTNAATGGNGTDGLVRITYFA